MHISQSTLLSDAYLLMSLSLRVATALATSLTPNIFMHSAAILKVLALKLFLAHDTTTWFKDLSSDGED